MTKVRLLLVQVVALAFAALGATHANAQPYPNRPVKLYVGAVAGGAPDIIARLLADRLSQALGQPFVVENRPGAGGTVVPGQVAKMPPDGYNLLVTDMAQIMVTPHLGTDAGYSPLTDFTPIALVATTPFFIVANSPSNLRTLSDLLAQARARPGALEYGSSGVGSTHHIAMEMFKAEAGVNILHVPYKGSGQSVPALLGGQVPVVVATLPTVGGYVKNGQAHLLAITTLRRSSDFPDVPALSEVVSGFDFASEIGVIAPANTPREVVKVLADAIRATTESADTSAKLKSLGATATYEGPEKYAQLLSASYRKYGDAVKAAKLKKE